MSREHGLSGCPHLSRSSYQSLNNLTAFAEELGVKQAVRHLSHEECNYPGVEQSERFTQLLREEIMKTFQGFDEFVDSYLEKCSIETCVEQYQQLIEHHEIDTTVMHVPEQKGYDWIIAHIREHFKDKTLIQLLIVQIEALVEQKQYSYQDATMKIMRQWQVLLAFQDKSGSSFMGGVLGSIDDETHQGLLAIANLQDKPYTQQQISDWNSAIQEDERYKHALYCMHFLFLEYIRELCTLNPQRGHYSFYPMQEICQYEAGDIVPNSRFLKILASNFGPSLVEHGPKDIEGGVTNAVKEKRIFEQYILGFIKKDGQTCLNAIEPKSCPAKRVIYPAAKKILPLLFDKL